MKDDSDSDSKPAIEPEVVPKISDPLEVVLPAGGASGRTDYSAQMYQKDAEIGAMIERLSRIGLSKTAVSIAARISPNELTKYYAEEFAAGQARMQEVVASAAMEQVMAGNPAMIMYMAKAKLGWTETNVVEHVGEIRAVVSAKPLTREEFEQRYLKKDESDDGV